MGDPYKTTPSLTACDSSQLLQGKAVTKLPAPWQHKLCEPCKAILRRVTTSNPDDYDAVENSHHLDAKSFQEALDLPCDICVRLQKVFNRQHGSYNPESFSTSSTRCFKKPYDIGKSSHTGLRLEFVSSSLKHYTYGTLEPYESRPDLHYQHITSNTGDVRALSFFVKQYQQCRTHHPKCQSLAPCNSFMPTRVIVVGCAGDITVRLCDRGEINTGAGYSALSHCWGKHSQPIMLEKSTVKMLKEGIPFSFLPRTFQDAITITRFFQVPYIWIDSLCIFQDDVEDWASEANRMRDVYGKANFTIAATAAQSGDVGLFFDRDIQGLTPIRVDTTWQSTPDPMGRPASGSYLFGFHDVTPFQFIDHSPLNKRAWVAQERFLSPRILHFTQALLFWECYTSFRSENHAISDVDLRNIDSSIGPSWLKRLVNDTRLVDAGIGFTPDVTRNSDGTMLTASRKIYQSWCAFIAHYTRCNLTKESDILVALVGIADEVGHAMSDCLVAGLWRKRFVEELCWRSYQGRHPPQRPTVWRAPSWSWASMIGCIGPSSEFGYQGRKGVIPYEMAAVIDILISTKPSGEVERGSVLLECRPVPASLVSITEGSIRFWCTTKKGMGRSFTEALEPVEPMETELGAISLDYPGDYHGKDGVLIDVQLLALLRFGFERYPTVVAGIVVVNSDSQAGAYERIGAFEYSDEAAARSVLAAYDKTQVKTITLV